MYFLPLHSLGRHSLLTPLRLSPPLYSIITPSSLPLLFLITPSILPLHALIIRSSLPRNSPLTPSSLPLYTMNPHHPLFTRSILPPNSLVTPFSLSSISLHFLVAPSPPRQSLITPSLFPLYSIFTSTILP